MHIYYLWRQVKFNAGLVIYHTHSVSRDNLRTPAVIYVDEMHIRRVRFLNILLYNG